jgi:hypothetical protein
LDEKRGLLQTDGSIVVLVNFKIIPPLPKEKSHHEDVGTSSSITAAEVYQDKDMLLRNTYKQIGHQNNGECQITIGCPNFAHPNFRTGTQNFTRDSDIIGFDRMDHN